MLHRDLREICSRNKDGSFATRANREKMLELFADQLAKIGFNVRKMKASDLKGRHINALVKHWKANGITAATIKNRMAVIRWWAEKVGKTEIVKENAVYGIENRVYVTNIDKSIVFNPADLEKVSVNVKISLLLQKNFGLRREEAMKFQPQYALDKQSPDTADHILIKPSWSKGGRGRTIPVNTREQRELLWQAMSVAKFGSMIPAGKTYKAHLSVWERETSAIGLGKTHGLRHKYAQERYKCLTGWECPAVAGIRKLTPEEKEKDKEVRLIISEELGHSRIAITNTYLGSWTKKVSNA